MGTGPEDYRCRLCRNLVLYRIDHQPTCKHHPSQDVDRWRQN